MLLWKRNEKARAREAEIREIEARVRRVRASIAGRHMPLDAQFIMFAEDDRPATARTAPLATTTPTPSRLLPEDVPGEVQQPEPVSYTFPQHLPKWSNGPI